MPDRSSTYPRDPNQLAKLVVDIATGNAPPMPPEQLQPEKDAAAVALGRRGGLKGGIARAEKLSAEQRREIARNAATARWTKKHDR